MIKYIGSKRKLIPRIEAAFADLPAGAAVLDLFSGTTRVAQALKRLGLVVTANDHNRYAWTLARCYIASDRGAVEAEAAALIKDLAQTPAAAGWFTRTYCEEARFFHPDNGARIEGIRNRIAEMGLPEVLESIALVSLMEAADRVDSTTGVQMAYLKQWAPRATNPLTLRLPVLLDGDGVATCLDAAEAARRFCGAAAYVDPPYNQHSYRSNYHVWETLIRWDAPEVYGVARKRIDCRTVKSDFNSKRKIAEAFARTIDGLDVERIVVSFNNEGFLDRDDIEAVLAQRGEPAIIEIDHKRYVGAQIGIFNPDGKRVGKVSHLRNKELLYIVDQDRDLSRQIAARVAESVGAALSR